MQQMRPKSTFANQNTLPRLPVPRLTASEPISDKHKVDAKYEPTLPRWLQSLKAVYSGAEFEKIAAVTHEFGRSGGVGERLSAALRERADAFPDSSWLAKWWWSWAYMGYRDSVVINVSYHYIFDAFPNAATQTERAALMALNFARAMLAIQQETLQPDEIRKIPQCMASYKNMFGTCRIPAKPDDYLVYAPPSECRHIIVACKNLFFSLNIFDPKTGLPLSAASIQAALENIKSQAQKLQNSQLPIGILTAQNRDTWTDIRQELLKDPKNLKSLQTIEKAAFVINLDDYNPDGVDETCKTLLHGKGLSFSSANRFFDKSFNIVVFPDGRAGLVGEHSGIDGYPTTVITDMVWEMTANPEHYASSSPHFTASITDAPETFSENAFKLSGGVEQFAKLCETSNVPAPAAQLLEFSPTSGSGKLKQYIDEASSFHEININNVDMTLVKFENYGTRFMKNSGVSPDGFVQMAFQLAYHRMHNAFSPVYESCSTRQYLHGRTEVGRSLSTNAVEFVQAMDDPKLSPLDKYSVFKKACESHIAYIRDASDGFGCDRHILGMKLIGKELGIEEHPFFALPAHAKTSHWSLSTSQLPSKHSVTGFGPVVADGYGFFYNLREKELNFHISSLKACKTTDAVKMSKSLRQTLIDIQAMCTAANQKAKL